MKLLVDGGEPDHPLAFGLTLVHAEALLASGAGEAALADADKALSKASCATAPGSWRAPGAVGKDTGCGGAAGAASSRSTDPGGARNCAGRMGRKPRSPWAPVTPWSATYLRAWPHRDDVRRG